jgi:hypothetical protein
MPATRADQSMHDRSGDPLAPMSRHHESTGHPFASRQTSRPVLGGTGLIDDGWRSRVGCPGANTRAVLAIAESAATLIGQ